MRKFWLLALEFVMAYLVEDELVSGLIHRLYLVRLILGPRLGLTHDILPILCEPYLRLFRRSGRHWLLLVGTLFKIQHFLGAGLAFLSGHLIQHVFSIIVCVRQ